MPETGIISKYPSGVDLVFEWKIGHFSTLKENDNGAGYYSPEFSVGGERWYLWIYPNGCKRRSSYGHVELHLWKCRSDRSMTQSFSLSLKTAKGEKYREVHRVKNFGTNYGENYYYIHRFVPKSELTRRNSELLLEGILTVVCTMKNLTSDENDRNDSERAYVEASTRRTEPSSQHMGASSQHVGASTETEEEEHEANASGSSTNSHEKKALQDFKELFLKKEDCDVTIRVKGSEFPSHRLILKARSPVLASTFQHNMKESVTGVLEIDDCNPSSFSDFLCFLYCADVQMITQKNVFDLFTLADKYQVLDLRSMCLELMKNNLTVDTFCETITLALQHSETELIKLSTDYFTKKAPEIIVTVKWQTFLAENPTESNELLIKLLVPNSS